MSTLTINERTRGVSLMYTRWGNLTLYQNDYLQSIVRSMWWIISLRASKHNWHWTPQNGGSNRYSQHTTNQIVSATIDPLIIIYRVSSFGFFIDSSSLFPKRRFVPLVAPRIIRRWGSGLKTIFFENFYWREYPQLSPPDQNVCSTIRVLSTTTIVFTE
jgi:hypothetical protein